MDMKLKVVLLPVADVDRGRRTSARNSRGGWAFTSPPAWPRPAGQMPWIEFAADISGVCRVAGTLLMTSKPTHRLSTKMMKSVSSMVPISRSLGRGLSGQRGVHDLALVRDHDPGHQLVVQVDGELAVA